MRTDTTTNLGYTLTYPDAIVWGGDDNYIRISGSTNIGKIRVRCYPELVGAVGHFFDYTPISQKDVVIHINDLLLAMNAYETLTIVVDVTGLNNYEFTIGYFRGKTLPYRNHGCSRVVSLTGLSSVQYMLTAAPVTMTWVEVSGIIRREETQVYETPGLISISCDKFSEAVPYVTFDYSDASRGGTPQPGIFEPTEDIVTLTSTNECVNKNRCVVEWYDTDGCVRHAVGLHEGFSTSVGQLEFRKSGLSIIRDTPARKVTDISAEITLTFDAVPKKMYIEEILTSEEVYITSADVSTSRKISAIPTTLNVMRDSGDYQDITITFKLLS